jgi:hypothetical protein
MKNNARLYLPWPLVSAFVWPDVGRPPQARRDRRNPPLASVERLDGGCLLYRLSCSRRAAERNRAAQHEIPT